jgi:hypothetical protein
MKTLLMHRDRDFDLQSELPSQAEALAQDLELGTLLRAMAAGDKFLFEVAQKALFSGLQNDVETIRYRQEILKDCLKNKALVRELYNLAVEAIEKRNQPYLIFFSKYPSGILYDSIELLKLFMDMLRRFRSFADEHAGAFASSGFRTLLAMLQKEFTDEYFFDIQNHLTELKFNRGALLSAELGPGNEGNNYMLRLSHNKRPSWLKRILGKGPPAYVVRIADRDVAGMRALSEIKDRGIVLVANALAQSMDHILGFFIMLRTELAFYVGCMNLHDTLASMEAPMSFPLPEAKASRALRFSGLYDVSLALTMGRSVVGNTVNADGKSLAIITGANQGGKSSFLRSIGLAQLMIHCGMFVAAESFTAELCANLFSHYKREEDATMKSGKLDEELGRMSVIVDSVAPYSLLLFNESFASTNEREGSEIARQIIRALLERRVKVFFVTHLYEFAHSFFEKKTDDAIFLRAERQADGTRTFRLVEGEPLETSYGEDLYREVFAVGTEDEPSTTRDARSPALFDERRGGRM